jgi:hypothetical protein
LYDNRQRGFGNASFEVSAQRADSPTVIANSTIMLQGRRELPMPSATATSHQDDLFHAVGSDDPAWVETMWFPFWVPDKKLTVYVHLVFMPNRHTFNAAVVIWDAGNRSVFEQPHRGELRELREFGDLDRLRLPNGLSVECLAPGQRYRIRFAHPECDFDVTFDALMPPVSIAPEESPGMYQGHIDQPGRVQGTMRLHGEGIGIDCHASRDRSWGPRHARSDVRIGNGHCTASDFFFFVYIITNERAEEIITGAYVMQNGKLARITRGARVIEWEGDRARRVSMRFDDSEGRSFEVIGVCANQRNLLSSPNLYVVLNLIEWFIDGTPVGWGESHDVWAQEAWTASGRALSV